MKVIKQTDSEFHFILRTYYVGMSLFLFVFLVLVAFLAWSEEIKCIRNPAGDIDTTVKHRFLGMTVSTRSFHGLRRADLQEFRASHGPDHTSSQPTFRVLLIGTRHTNALTRSFTNGPEQAEIANAINRFIASNQTRFDRVVTYPPKLLVSAFVALGVALWLWQPVEGRLDRTTDTAVLIRRSILGRKRTEVALSDLSRFGFETSYSGSNNSASSRTIACFQSGEVLPLGSIYGPGSRGKRRDVDRLNRFLERSRSHTPPQQIPVVISSANQEKICVVCGRDCSSEPRFRDPDGHYYHQSCYSRNQWGRI